MSQLGALKSPLFKILSPLFQYSAQATQVPASLVNMLGFTKTLSLLALMAAGGTQIANACDCSGCSSTTFSGSTTIESSCSSSQTSYVEDVKIANDDDYSSSFSYSAGAVRLPKRPAIPAVPAAKPARSPLHARGHRQRALCPQIRRQLEMRRQGIDIDIDFKLDIDIDEPQRVLDSCRSQPCLPGNDGDRCRAPDLNSTISTAPKITCHVCEGRSYRRRLAVRRARLSPRSHRGPLLSPSRRLSSCPSASGA